MAKTPLYSYSAGSTASTVTGAIRSGYGVTGSGVASSQSYGLSAGSIAPTQSYGVVGGSVVQTQASQAPRSYISGSADVSTPVARTSQTSNSYPVGGASLSASGGMPGSVQGRTSVSSQSSYTVGSSGVSGSQYAAPAASFSGNSFQGHTSVTSQSGYTVGSASIAQPVTNASFENTAGRTSVTSQSSYTIGSSSIAQPLTTGTVEYTVNNGNDPQPIQTSRGLAPTLLSAPSPLPSPAVRNPRVEYFSASRGCWIPATFQGINAEFSTYTLDVQPYARAGDVRYAPGADAEYYSKSRDSWVPAKVETYNEDFNTYALDIQPFAKPEDVRLAGFPEALKAPNMDGDVSRRVKRPPTLQLDPATFAGIPDEVAAEEEEDLTEYVNSLSSSDRLPVGARVEYFTKGTWHQAKVLGFNEGLGTYTLDIRPYAMAGFLRLPGPLERTPGAPGAQGGGEEADSSAPEADGEAVEEDKLDEQPMSSVPQFNVQKQKEGGRTVFCIFVAALDGVPIRAFDGDCTDFLLTAEADALRTWLDGVSNDMLPGLLTLLQHEVSSRHEILGELQKEKESYHGIDDYAYFGLSEESTDKDIDRAYRKSARELHPDKGGDQAEFDEMRKRYEQLKSNRGGEGEKKKEVSEGDPLSWDPADRASMLNCHDRMRSFLVWVKNDLDLIVKDLEELRRRHTAIQADRRCLGDDGMDTADAAAEQTTQES